MINRYEGIVTLRANAKVTYDELYCIGRECAINQMKHDLTLQLLKELENSNLNLIEEIEDKQHNLLLEIECNIVTKDRLLQLLKIEEQYHSIMNN